MTDKKDYQKFLDILDNQIEDGFSRITYNAFIQNSKVSIEVGDTTFGFDYKTGRLIEVKHRIRLSN